MKRIFIIAATAALLAACGQKTADNGKADSTKVADTIPMASMAEEQSPYLSPDLRLHGLKGPVKKVTTIIYESDKNGKKIFERHRTSLVFNKEGMWTANEKVSFKASDIERDSQGRIKGLKYRYIIDKEEDYGYDYEYEYSYNDAGMLAEMKEDYVGELSGNFNYKYLYFDDAESDNGDVRLISQVGGGDGVEVVSETQVVSLTDYDKYNNWTRCLQKETCTTTENYGDEDKQDTDTSTNYTLQIRKIEYFE